MFEYHGVNCDTVFYNKKHTFALWPPPGRLQKPLEFPKRSEQQRCPLLFITSPIQPTTPEFMLMRWLFKDVGWLPGESTMWLEDQNSPTSWLKRGAGDWVPQKPKTMGSESFQLITMWKCWESGASGGHGNCTNFPHNCPVDLFQLAVPELHPSITYW